MTQQVFGIDFGTTNSLAAVVLGNRAIALTDQASNRPHPSVIWYRGGEVVVGREARDNLDLTEAGAPPGFVRSPKMNLRREGPIYVDGKPVEPTDAVAEVLKYLKRDAIIPRKKASGYEMEQAVMTIPVNFGGPERRALREAARKAGIGITQFVHEPVAALYAYLRSKDDLKRELARFEERAVIVFDWGGGTLDLTLCRIQGGAIMQIANLGDNGIGGDQFDYRLRNFLRARHAKVHNIDDVIALEHPGMAAKLLHRCENIKIGLSDPEADEEDYVIKNYLKAEGRAADLIGAVTRDELNTESKEIVAHGLAQIDHLLSNANLKYEDVELCLATGGMVNMPAIRDGLTERFPGRVPKLENGDRIIAEGAAWIAHDGLRLTLSKPIEILIATTSERGAYYPLVPAGWCLPLQNEIQPVTNKRLYCTDPTDGVAVIEFAKPAKVGPAAPTDARLPLLAASVEVDPNARALIERIECELTIDHDYVVNVHLHSTARNDHKQFEFHDLDFGLALPATDEPDGQDTSEEVHQSLAPSGKRKPLKKSNSTQRTNITLHNRDFGGDDYLWQRVPGHIIERYQPNFYAYPTEASELQMEERNFYLPCVTCGRIQSEIDSEGLLPICGKDCAPREDAKLKGVRL